MIAEPKTSINQALLAGLVFFGALAIHYWATRDFVVMVGIRDGMFHINDFAYYLTVVNGVWFEGAVNMYDPESHKVLFSEVSGLTVNLAMPLGVTPIITLVLLPFAFISKISLHLAYSVWVATSFSLLFFAARGTYNLVATLPHSVRRYGLISLGMVLISITQVVSLVYGQTSITATAVLLFVVTALYKSETRAQPLPLGLCTVALVFLSLKPPYLFFGGSLLFFFCRWKELLYGAGAITILLGLVSTKLGLGWPAQYLSSLSVFGKSQIPADYVWAFNLPEMNIFRRAVNTMLTPDIALLVTQMVLLTCLVLLFIYGVARALQSKLTKPSDNIRLFLTAAGIYLLFSPYIGSYEELLFAPMLAAALLFRTSTDISTRCGLILALLTFTVLNQNALHGATLPILFWFLKVALLFVMLYIARSDQEKSTP